MARLNASGRPHETSRGVQQCKRMPPKLVSVAMMCAAGYERLKAQDKPCSTMSAKPLCARPWK